MWSHRQRLIIRAKISLLKCGSENNSRGKSHQIKWSLHEIYRIAVKFPSNNRLAKTLWEEVMARGGLHPTINVCVCARVCVHVWVPVHTCVSKSVSGVLTHSCFILKEMSIRGTGVKRLECVQRGGDMPQGGTVSLGKEKRRNGALTCVVPMDEKEKST